MLLKAVGQPLGIWLKEHWKAAGKCPNNRCHPIGEEAKLPSGYQQKRGNVHPLSLKYRPVLRICLNLLKVARAIDNFKNTQGFFCFCCFQPCHSSPDSTWCDSPFKQPKL
jgi:hypothetical protein